MFIVSLHQAIAQIVYILELMISEAEKKSFVAEPRRWTQHNYVLNTVDEEGKWSEKSMWRIGEWFEYWKIAVCSLFAWSCER